MNLEDKKYLIDQVDKKLLEAIESSNEANELLELAKQYGTFHWVNATGKMQASELEEILLEKLTAHLPPFWAAPDRDVISHVISDAYDIGGHTPLCINFMKEQQSRGRPVQCVLTRNATQNVLNELHQGNIKTVLPEFSGLSKLFFLIQTFLNSKSVVLYIHPDDIIATLATMIAERNGVPCYFVNHANIHFSYASSQASAVLEVDAYSYLLSKKHRNVRGHSFVGIPCSEIDANLLALRQNSDNIQDYFVTVGSVNKFCFEHSPMFTNFIELLCGKMKQKLKLIGVTNSPALQKLSPEALENLELLGPQSRDKTLEIMAKAKAYIDSFPEGGGTSVTNAMRMKLPLFGCRAPAGMYGEDFLYPSVEALVEGIQLFLKQGEDIEKLELRANFYTKNHSAVECVNRLEATMGGEDVPLLFDFDETQTDLNYYQAMEHPQKNFYLPPAVKVNY